ncbi:MAG TPA: cupin, partial [Sphingomicrobium sp.]|nr:cupin [Sphingomicrobium sp.]
RMILVSGQLEEKYQGAAAATLNPGNYAFGPANLPHRATCMGTAQCHLFVAFEGPVDVVAVEGMID